MKFSVNTNRLFKQRKLGQFKSSLKHDTLFFFVLFPGGLSPSKYTFDSLTLNSPTYYKNSFVRKNLTSSGI
jgi:hypothetical protein